MVTLDRSGGPAAARPGRRQLGGALLAVLLVVSQLGGLLHRVLVDHVACAEHGELVHGAAAPAVTPVDRPALARAGSEAASELRSASAEEATGAHEHDHCLLAAGHTASRPGEQQVTVLRPAVRVMASPAPEQAPLRRGAIYLIAPKHSPPPALLA